MTDGNAPNESSGKNLEDDGSAARQSYRLGGLDQRGRCIDAIFSHYQDYIIYESRDVFLMEGRTDSLDGCPELASLISEVIASSRTKGPRRRRLYFELSNIIDQCMANKQAEAINRAKALIAKISRQTTSGARLYYLWSAIGAVGILWVFTSVMSLIAPQWNDVMWWEVMSVGATGALFSVMLNQRTIPIDNDGSSFVHWTAGASRAVIGVISGAVCYLAIKSGIALSFATHSDANSAVFFFCCLSGFSETFVPNLLNSHEKDVDRRRVATE